MSFFSKQEDKRSLESENNNPSAVFGQKPPKHELIFLGSGGGRINCVTQHRKTGGFIYSFDNQQIHIDPGPGAIVYLNQLKIDRLKTKFVIVTHAHTDHNNDVPVILESMHKRLEIPAGTLISTEHYINTLQKYYHSILKRIIAVKPGDSFKLTENLSLLATKTVHTKVPGFGFILTYSEHSNGSNSNSSSHSKIKYKLAYTSDTEIYDGYTSVYKDADILIGNVLRPDDKHCDRHASVDEIIPAIMKIKPKIFIMYHFGAMMDSDYIKKNLVPEQVKKIQKAVGKQTKVIASKFGLRIPIDSVFI